MPALESCWLVQPHDIVQQIYEKHNGSVNWEKELQEYFVSKLCKEEVWCSIPSLNHVPVKDIQHGQLVRFRGMIQDQMGPEMYGSGALLKNATTGVQKVITGKFKDELNLGRDEELVNWNSTESRQCYYCVPIPGETTWVKNVFAEKGNRFRTQLTNPIVVGKKRPLEEEEDNSDMMECAESKRPCPDETSNPAAILNGSGSMEKILNFPLPSSESVGCILKMYTEEELPLNDVVEVVGIVSFNTPGVVAVEGEEKEDFQPPSSIILRIHCIVTHNWNHNNPLLSPNSSPKWDEESASVIAGASATRDEIHGLLTNFFTGDSLAADYLLCNLLSRVYTRKDALALGKLSLNLSNVSQTGTPQLSYTRSLYSLLECLVTKAHFLPMSLNAMNTLRLIPKKDYQENRLISGCLQLSASTHLVLDETAMTEGQLLADGVRNVTALGNVCSWQKIEYDFNFHPVEFHVDIPVLILSERRSMVASDVHLPLRLDSSAVNNCVELVNRLETDTQLLARMRNYLTVVRLMPFSLSDSMQEAVQNDFIQSRVPGQTNTPMTPEDLHLLLVLSRLLAMSFGQTELTEPLWQRAKSMELERKSRLSANR